MALRRLFKKKPKCRLCRTKYDKKHEATIRYETADGIVEMDVCPVCAHILDSSAELMTKREDTDNDDTI